MSTFEIYPDGRFRSGLGKWIARAGVSYGTNRTRWVPWGLWCAHMKQRKNAQRYWW